MDKNKVSIIVFDFILIFDTILVSPKHLSSFELFMSLTVLGWSCL